MRHPCNGYVLLGVISMTATFGVGATSVMPVTLPDLFSEADVVAHVYIVAGEGECHDVAVYKAKVLAPFKVRIPADLDRGFRSNVIADSEAS